ncbi:ATP-binding protein [Pedobacter nototheniae]|uniref:ATP-binding protein n=1 Tax=Pedobacter nototheniae TaxID=2488994 RepID=UPI00292EDA36|nr:ATP-binding protein [Pedobacter nototheniae]
MKIKSLRIQNFRGYKDETFIQFDDLTVLVGKNDVGKSTVLEALDVFFNDGKGVVKLDKDDINKAAINSGDNVITIAVTFQNLPLTVVIDTSNETTLAGEYLLNNDGDLEIIKRYPNAGTAKVFIKANHPTHAECSDLLLAKNAELKKTLKNFEIECENQTANAIIRKAIWEKFADELALAEVELDVTKGETKDIWEKLQSYLPFYILFQSDRKNSDNDSEVQDPLKKAVAQILADTEISTMLDEVAQRVSIRLKEVSDSTLLKLQEMHPELASSLNPVIPASSALKWNDVFKSVSISGDENIPINKRGSGVKRLILLNFFRAEAERRLTNSDTNSIIYAIEEPETSQHTDHQKILIKAFRELAAAPNTQVLMTTHSSTVVKGLSFEHIRLVAINAAGNKCIDSIEPNQLPYPSLNEINYIAFKDLTEEYHNELYGFIEAEGLLIDYRNGKDLIAYNKIRRGGVVAPEQIILTEYIRHQIHHPENTNNTRYSFEQLTESVDLMRNFILNQNNN